MLICRLCSNSDVAIFVCQTLSKLAKVAANWEEAVLQELAIAVFQCTKHHKNDTAVVKEGCDCIGSIVGVSSLCRQSLIEQDILGTVLKLLNQHDRCLLVVEQCVFAIGNLALDPPAPRMHSMTFKAINKILLQYRDVEKVVLWAFVAISRLCEGDKNMARLLITPLSIVDAMFQFAGNAEIIVWGLRCVLGLLPSPENISRFQLAGLAECLSNILSDHSENEAMVELVLIILALVGADDTIRMQLSNHGICRNVSLVLKHFRESSLIATNGCKTIARLAFGSVANCDSLVAENIVFVLCKVMGYHEEAEDVQIAASYAVSALATIDTSKSVLSASTDILDFTLKNLRRGASMELSIASCAVVARLCIDDDVCREYLGNHGACEDLVAVLSRGIEDGTLCREVCFAIYSIVDGSPANAGRYQESICALLTEVLTRHSYLPAVTERCLTALICLVNYRHDFIETFGTVKLSEALVNLQKINLKNEIVVEKILQTIVVLKPLNAKLGEVGCCNGVISTLVTHAGSTNIAQWACCAISSLSEDPTNRAILGALRACEAVVGLLSKYIDTSLLARVVLPSQNQFAGIALWACRAIFALGHDNQGLQSVLGRAGACELVGKALSIYRSHENVAHACCMAVSCLSEFSAEHKSLFGESGICVDLVEVLRLHVASGDVALWALRAADSLALENDDNILALVAAGACETVPVTMQAHQRVEAIALAGCSLIASLASSPNSAARLGTPFFSLRYS